MKTLHMEIVGMTCDHCVRAIRNRLAATDGVQVDDVQVGHVDIHYDPSKVSTDDIQDAISDEGYTVDEMTAAT